MLERISGSLLDPEALYVRDDALFGSEELRGLNLVMGFTGFADAGHVVSQITAELLDTLDGEMIAEFDADQLIDYRTRRPQVSFVEDHVQDYQAPTPGPVPVESTVWGTPSSCSPGSSRTCNGSALPAQWSASSKTSTSTWSPGSTPFPCRSRTRRPVGVTVHGNRPDLIEGISGVEADRGGTVGRGPRP